MPVALAAPPAAVLLCQLNARRGRGRQEGQRAFKLQNKQKHKLGLVRLFNRDLKSDFCVGIAVGKEAMAVL